MTARISVSLIVKNEEATLPTCLRSVGDLVHEIIVVDTGSSDQTKHIAAGFGARVFDFPWIDSFAAARNASLEPATGDWILWLDGDEFFDEDNRGKLQGLFGRLGDEPVGYIMKQRSAPETPGGAATLVDQCRLFRNDPAIRWSYRVHEQILPGLKRAGHQVRFTDICIEHSGYVDPALRRRKTERNLRLLQMEYAEQPDDPFTLFNLGWAFLELGQVREALPMLARSLERSRPGDSIVRKLYALLVHGHKGLGQWQEAQGWCRAGLARCPDDPELLFLQSLLLEDQGEAAAADATLRRLETLQPGAHFASVDTGLRGYKARFHRALLARRQGRLPEAEELYRAALAEAPLFTPAWLELSELYLAQGRWEELTQALAHLPDAVPWSVEVAALRARAYLARREFAAARSLLEEVIARFPQALKPRVILTHVLLQENHDPAAAERALREVLELEPHQPEAWRNLTLPLRSQGRPTEALAACQAGRRHCPGDGRLLLQHGLLLSDTGDEAGAERLLLQYLETQPLANGQAGPSTARHQLARIYHHQNRHIEAEGQWRAVLAEYPTFIAAWVGLGELCLSQERWAELDDIIGRLENGLQVSLDALVLRARRHYAEKEVGAALQMIEKVCERFPEAVWPRVIRSRFLLGEGRDDEAEEALRGVLALDPHHREARQNLAVFHRRRGAVDGGQRPVSEQGAPPQDAGRGKAAVLCGDTPVIHLLPRKCLRVALASYYPQPFQTETPYTKPLGGSESALCYLAEVLAARAHEVFLLNAGGAAGLSRGLPCLPLNAAAFNRLPALDALVVQNCAGHGRALRAAVGPRTRLLFWSQHAHDHPAVQPLRDRAEREAYDAFILVSDWQREHYREQFGIDAGRAGVLRNGISPAFGQLFGEGETITEAKSRPPVLAYTSTPYRGLDCLLKAFPRIRAAVPGTTLEVYSSWQIYGVPEAEDQARFGKLYEQCRALEGVEYVGPVPQPELARRLRRVAVLAYPNTYPETSCIAVLEAMAAGCRVVTSQRGALPETTAGFAMLIPIEGSPEEYLERFVEETVAALGSLADAEDHLRRQVDHVNRRCTWAAWADAWVQWLS